MNKMVMAVIPRDEAEHVLDALINAGFSATFMETKGGMLRQSQYSLFTAVSTETLDNVLDIIKNSCKTDIALDEDDLTKQEILENSGAQKLGGAVIFVWDLDRLETY
jgi:uncharacterized protein YaaQ